MIDMKVTPVKQGEELRVAISAEIARAVRESLRRGRSFPNGAVYNADAGPFVMTCIVEPTGPHVTNWNAKALGPGNSQPTHLARVMVSARVVRRADGAVAYTKVLYSHPRHGTFERPNRERGQVAAEMVVLGAALLV